MSRSSAALAVCLVALSPGCTKEPKRGDQTAAGPSAGDDGGSKPGPKESSMATLDSDILEIVEGSTLADLTWPKGKARAKLSAIDDVPAKLEAICLAGSVSGETRFKACEAFFTLGGAVSSDADRSAIAGVYAEAMATARTHNPWSLPETVKSSATSRHLIALGRPALPALKPLLGDDSKLSYEGSEEPTISEMRDYRIYDLAGAIAAAISGRSYPSEDDDPAARKKAASELQAAID